jgi:hypothetical protein
MKARKNWGKIAGLVLHILIGGLMFPGCRRAGGGGRMICFKRSEVAPRMRPNLGVVS